MWSVLGGSGRQMKSPIGNTGPFLMQGRGKRPILKWKINSPSGNLFIDRFHLASSSRPDNIITLLSPFGRVFIISHIKSSSSDRWLISSRGNASLDQFYTGWATGWRWRWPASGRRRETHTERPETFILAIVIRDAVVVGRFYASFDHTVQCRAVQSVSPATS